VHSREMKFVMTYNYPLILRELTLDYTPILRYNAINENVGVLHDRLGYRLAQRHI